MKRMSLAIVTMLVASACNTTTASIRVPQIGVVSKDLERDEYVVLGNAEGRACVEQSCWLGLWCTVKDDAGNAIKVLDENGFEILGGALGTPEDVSRVAEDRAMYAALKAQPDADAIFTPRKSMDITTENKAINASVKSCVRVFGKSVRIKTDEELHGTASRAPAPPPPPASTGD